MSQGILTKNVPILIASIVIILTIGDYFVKFDVLQNSVKGLTLWGTIVSAFLVILGLLNVSQYHVRIIRQKDITQRLLSIWFIFLTLLTFILGSININDPTFRWLFNNYAQWSSCVQSMLAFFIIAATFRGMRAKSKEATVLLLSGLFVLLANMPMGGYIWASFIDIGDWINKNIVGAGQIALLIGATFGAVATIMRLMAGKERGYLGE